MDKKAFFVQPRGQAFFSVLNRSNSPICQIIACIWES